MSNSTPEVESAVSAQREWSDAEPFFNDYTAYPSLEKYHILGMDSSQQIVFNPRFPDTIEVLEKDFRLLKELAESYTAVDALTNRGATEILSFMDEVEYILRFDVARIGRRENETSFHWTDHMVDIQRKIEFAPNYYLWDKATRELEGVATAAIKASEKVLDARGATKKGINTEIVNGIYLRVELLQQWTTIYLLPVRARDDYKRWKEEKEMALPTSQIRKRKIRKNEAASSGVELYQLSETVIPKTIENSSRIENLSHNLQDDLTIWILNLIIYFSCAIIQAVAFTKVLPSPPSPSDYLNNLQTTMTQVLSVFMTYTLSSRTTPSWTLSMRFRAWTFLAVILPIVAIVVLRWNVGMSALLSFMGTVVNGCLQVTLAIGIRETTLPP